MNHFIPITIAYGDGTGPEIMEAVLYLLKEASVPLRIEIVEIGEKLYTYMVLAKADGHSYNALKHY